MQGSIPLAIVLVTLTKILIMSAPSYIYHSTGTAVFLIVIPLFIDDDSSSIL